DRDRARETAIEQGDIARRDGAGARHIGNRRPRGDGLVSGWGSASMMTTLTQGTASLVGTDDGAIDHSSRQRVLPPNPLNQELRWSVPTLHASASLALDIRRLDDGPPLFNFGFVMGSQRLRGQLFKRRNLRTQINQSLPHRRIGQCLNDGGIQLFDGCLGRAFGCPQPSPERDMQPRQPSLVYSRNFGRRGPPTMTGDGG